MKSSFLSVASSQHPGEVLFIHSDRDVASSAFNVDEKITINVLLPENIGTISAKIIIYSEKCNDICEIVSGEWTDRAGAFDVYSFTPFTPLDVGIYFFRIELKTSHSTLYSSGEIYNLKFSDRYVTSPHLQLSVTDFKHQAPDALYGGIIYHIFVDRFNRGGEVKLSDGARLLSGEWQSIPEYPEYPGAPLKNNTFYGGTLFGIADRLDYISSLGVTAIYLSPIFSSPSNHKYDTADYMSVDEMFGGDEALIHLINEAKSRGIKIILDGVFNHTGSDSIYFNKYGRYKTIGAYQSESSPYYDWYDFQNHPDEYTCWWGIDILPRINPDKPSCGDFFTAEGGVISKYRDMGIYGMRLDVVDELSDNFVSNIKNTLTKNGEAVLFGEVWEDASNKIAYGIRKHYYLGCELDGVMNYPLRAGMLDYFTGKGIGKLLYALREVMINAPDRIMHAEMNLLGTHDTERILTLLSGESAIGLKNSELAYVRLSKSSRKKATEKLISAYTVLATLPGIPTIFYGDEAGMEGYSDPFNRMPYPWGREDKKLISHYKKVGRIRKKYNSAYSKGAFSLLCLTDNLLAFSRRAGSEIYITVYNNSDNEISITSEHETKSLIRNRVSAAQGLMPYSADIFLAGCDVTLQFEEKK